MSEGGRRCGTLVLQVSGPTVVIVFRLTKAPIIARLIGHGTG